MSDSHESITIDDAVSVLNEALELDERTMRTLVLNRVQCNDALAGHPTIQVLEKDGIYKVGLLGILNGLFGQTNGVIGADFSAYCSYCCNYFDRHAIGGCCPGCGGVLTEGKLLKFRRLDREPL